MRNFFAFTLLFIGFSAIVAQTRELDSLQKSLKITAQDTSRVKTLNTLSWKFVNRGDYNEALHYANLALRISRAASASMKEKPEANKLVLYVLNKGQARAYFNMGAIYNGMGNYKTALEFYFKSSQVREEIGDKKGLASSYSNIGVIYQNKGDFEKALAYQLKTLKLSEELNDQFQIASSNICIGLLHGINGKYNKALESLLKVQNAIPKGEAYTPQWKKLNGTLFLNLGNVYLMKGNFDTSMVFYSRSLKIDEAMGNKQQMASTYNNIAAVNYSIADYAKTLEYMLKALEIQEQIHDKHGIATSYNNLGNTYLRTHKVAEAKQCQLKSLTLSKELGAKDLVVQVYYGLAAVDSALSDYKSAFMHHKLYTLYKDSIYNAESEKKMVQAEMQHDFEKKEAIDKAEQDKKETMHKAELVQQTIQRNALTGGFALMLILAGVSYKSFRNKRKANVQLKEKNHLIEEKQKEILDSITYAKRLQEAILPPAELVKQFLPESFILYKPKDIVAGDFYWIHPFRSENEKDELILFAAADCTGHGVPGALVSVVCSNALNRTVKEFGITEPGKLLDKVRELVLETFQKSRSEVKDGMDISLLQLNPANLQLKWSGANNALWIINSNKELKEIKADKQPIGFSHELKPFTTHTLQLHKGDSIYLFTDGYADQFGGNKGKKFKYAKMKELLLSVQNNVMEQQMEILDSTFTTWKGKLEQVDDVCVIGLKV